MKNGIVYGNAVALNWRPDASAQPDAPVKVQLSPFGAAGRRRHFFT